MTDQLRALVALAVLVVTVAAVVVLKVTHNDAGDLIGWLGPIVTGLWAVSEVRSTKNGVLSEIAENTNGKLTARIESAVHNALDMRAVQDARIRLLSEKNAADLAAYDARQAEKPGG